MPEEPEPERTGPKPKTVSGQVIRLKTRRKPRSIRGVPGLGTVTLQGFISVRMGSDARDAAAESSTPGAAYASSLLSQAVIKPPLTPEDAASLSTGAWHRLASELAEEMGVASQYDALDSDMDPRDRLYEADQARWKEFGKDLALGLQPLFATFRKLAEPPPGIARVTLGDVIGRSLAASLPQPPTVGSLLGSMQGIGSLGTMARLSQSLAAMKGPAIDFALISSRINSPMIHTPTFVPALPSQPPVRRLPSPEKATQARMLDAYDVLVQLEQSMRQAIENRLAAKVGPGWWRQRIPEQIKAACQLSQSKAASANDGRSLIEYAYVDDYRAIILRKDNWTEVFEAIFGNAVQTDACFQWCAAARVEIAHARPLTDRLYADFIFGARRLIAAIQSASLVDA